ncbi:MAG: tyrosine recombinase [Erysipelotrichales bacterium]|nr:tyrosine recombinase [Erysipelotrichales bacterium]
MDSLIERFIDYIRIQRNYSNNTEINYLIDLDSFSSYLKSKKIKYNELNYKEISLYTKYLKEVKELESSSINRHLSAIRSFYNYLVTIGEVKSNPFKLVSGPKKAMKLPNYMKYSEFEEMINACDDTDLSIRNRALLELLLATGARIGELINIKVNDIDFSNKEIKVLGKGNKERICYFNEHAEKSLKDYINNSRFNLLKDKSSDYLFINHIGTPLTTRGVRTIIDNIIKKSSINTKITPHTFRHTFATMLLNEGCDLKSVQELLGHVNLSTTSIYTHITNDRIKDIYLHAHPRSKK